MILTQSKNKPEHSTVIRKKQVEGKLPNHIEEHDRSQDEEVECDVTNIQISWQPRVRWVDIYQIHKRNDNKRSQSNSQQVNRLHRRSQ